MFKLGLGMWAYDVLALMHAPKLHEKLSADGAMDRVGILRRSGLQGAYLYSDAYMDDDRLVVETLRSADRFGATFANYVKAGRGEFDEKGRLKSIQATDQKSSRSFTIRAKHFISSVGPWTDQFASSLFEWKKILRPSKGIHLTFRRERVPIHEAIVMATGPDKRIIFAIPRHEMVIVGTTDTDYPLSPETVHSERADVDYLLNIVGNYFPNAGITEKDIVASYSGVRPLVNDGSATESKTSREHVIIHSPHNVTFVAGGKYTTYRRMARDVVENVLAHEFALEDRIKFARNQTREAINPLVTSEKLAEATAVSDTWAREFGLTAAEMRLLAERHGFEARDIVERGRSQGLHRPWQMEALFAINYTMCLHLRDFMLRRSPLFLAYHDHGISQIDSIVDVFVKSQGWDAARVVQEKQMFKDHLNFELGWRR
jgi:glycerol-3-phosphate dehydrogenase